jgi:DNA-binding NtrC family response regulator
MSEDVRAGEVLIVEDEANLSELMTDLLGSRSIGVVSATSIAGARERLEKHRPDLILLDVKLPDGDGIELLSDLRRSGVQTPAIIITAFGTVERAAAAMRAGASDFLVKPFDNERFVAAVAAALETANALYEVELRAGKVEARTDASRAIVGSSGSLAEVVAILGRVSATDATVLITGESGTGKELVARAIHAGSPRLDGPFLSVNCSAIAPTLIESELFGFERGAFTGAHAQKKGLVEAAEGGTMFLDEIGDMPLEAQAKLLRVLQEREITRIGGRRPVPVDVRVIAATHRDLPKMVEEGRFRQDLLYRLDVVPIRLPPLRARRQDIPGLVDHFVEKLARKHRTRAPIVTGPILERLSAHDWPGNVRELENMIERWVIVGRLDLAPAGEDLAPAIEVGRDVEVKPLRTAVAEAERRAVVAALRHAKGNKAEAARLLGISYKTLFNKIHEHDIKEGTWIE